MEIKIEKAAPADAAMLLEYFKQAGGETDNLTFGKEGLPISVEREAAFISGMENSTDDVMFIAKYENKIVGCTSLSRLPRRMKHRADFAVSVAKDYWNKGIGSGLLSHIIEFARENNVEIIDLQVRSDNKRAIHLYKKYGFKKTGEHPAFLKIEDENIPFDIMCLELNKQDAEAF